MIPDPKPPERRRLEMPRSIALALLSSALAQTLLDVLIAPESAPALSVAAGPDDVAAAADALLARHFAGALATETAALAAARLADAGANETAARVLNQLAVRCAAPLCAPERKDSFLNAAVSLAPGEVAEVLLTFAPLAPLLSAHHTRPLTPSSRAARR